MEKLKDSDLVAIWKLDNYAMGYDYDFGYEICKVVEHDGEVANIVPLFDIGFFGYQMVSDVTIKKYSEVRNLVYAVKKIHETYAEMQDRINGWIDSATIQFDALEK